MAGAQIVVETAGWLRVDGAAENADARLEYDPGDPFAVTLALQSGSRRERWVFGRDLLADGLRSMVPVGEGEIRIQATSVLSEIARTDSSGTTVKLRLPWWNTREFLRLTQVAVPRGQESCDVDGWLAALTRTSDP
jgi:hypothetical protein